MKVMKEFAMDGWTIALVELGFFVGFESAKRSDDDRNEAAKCIDWVVIHDVLTNLKDGNIPRGGRDFVLEALLPEMSTLVGLDNILHAAARHRESCIRPANRRKQTKRAASRLRAGTAKSFRATNDFSMTGSKLNC